MNMTPATVTLAVILGAATTASANHYYQLEETAYELLRDARTVRWAVRESCSYASDYRDLVRRSDEVYAHVLHLQEVLLQQAPFAAICDEVEHIEQALCALDERLKRCSYGVAYHSSPLGRHVSIGHHQSGHGHGIQWYVTRMTRTLRELHDTARHLAGGVVTPLPTQPYVPYNASPAPGVPQVIPPQGPQFHGTPVPSSGQSRSGFTIPLRIGGKHGMMVQIGR